jgi:4-amino-4-deoxy-L-arabinose transferase-like glycosyltransferase
VKNWYWWGLVFIVVIGAVFRLYRLDVAPPHLSNDEISIAYDAYSIARTGKDEHSNPWPIAFQSHSTYKAPLYAYILAPLTLVLNNTETTTRLPSAILGTGTIIVLGLLMTHITGSKILGLIGAGVLATNPWHIYTSRMALESNVALFFMILGIWLWLRGQKVFATIAMGLSIYGYHTQWLLTPIIMSGLIIGEKKYLKNVWYLLLLILICLPIGLNFVKNLGTTARANTEMVWKHPELEARLEDPQTSPIMKPILIGQGILGNYWEYWNWNYLFGDGLQILPNNNIYQPGLFLFPQIIFLIIGLFGIKKYIKKEYVPFIFFWLVISPLIPAMTNGGTNLVRNLPVVVPMILVISMGIYGWMEKSSKNIWIGGILFMISFGYFWMIYFHHFPKQSGINYQYGYKQEAEDLVQTRCISGCHICILVILILLIPA